MELAERRVAEREQALERRVAAREEAAADAVQRTEVAIERMGAAIGLIRDQFEAAASELRAAAAEVQRSKLAGDGRDVEAGTERFDNGGSGAFEFPRGRPARGPWPLASSPGRLSRRPSPSCQTDAPMGADSAPQRQPDSAPPRVASYQADPERDRARAAALFRRPRHVA